ncbi:hypothetical protein GF407_02320 [candidate division KSB1 bacterium]|nr:hypothetical protein [candidate division KSB1 bacterium]
MHDRIVEFLRMHDRGASSQELAFKVLKLKNCPPELCDKLVSAAVADDPRLFQRPDGEWTLHRNPTFSPRYAAIRSVPARVSHWRQWQGMIFWLVDDRNCIVLDRNHFDKDLKDVLRRLEDKILIFEGFGNQLTLFKRAFQDLLHSDCPNQIVILKEVLQTRFNDRRFNSSQDITAFFKTPQLENATLQEEASAFCDQIDAFLQQVPMDTKDEDPPAVDFSGFGFDQAFIRNLPKFPGVYLMYDRANQLLYVGKAKNLHQRVSSYFRAKAAQTPRLEVLLSKLYRIDYMTKGSELEALLCEQRLIQKFNPPVNRQMEVQERPHRRKHRYERILILPSTNEKVLLYCMHPENGLLMVSLQQNLSNKNIVTKVIQRFFFDQFPQKPGAIEAYKIALSWLSDHEEEVNSIDMRQVPTAEQAIKLIGDYVRFSLESKAIHQS